MTRVYVDPAAATIDPTAAAGSSVTDSDAIDALRLLVETGADLYLLTDHPAEAPAELSALVRGTAREPDRDPAGPAWLLVADVARAAHLPPGVLSILVGPSRPGPRAVTRCDLEAPTVRAAVLEILAREAMPAGR